MTAVSLTIAIAALLVLGAVLTMAGGEGPPAPRTASTSSRPAVHVAQQGCDDARTADQARDPATPWCTLDRALAAAPKGSDVVVAAGSYPALKVDGDGTARDVRLRAPDGGGRPTLAGAQLNRVRGLAFSRFIFTGAVTIRASADVSVEDSGFASSTLYMRESRRVKVTGNRFRDVRNGERAILAQGAVAPGEATTEDLLIRGNRFDNIAHDAIAVYNGYKRVTVEDNEIARVWRPEGADYHSDAMQFMGGDQLTIRRNVLHDNNQGILVKDGRASRHLVVTGNLITDGGAGLQIFNAPRARVSRNTIWNTRFGTIFSNDESLPGRTSVRLTDNVLDQLLLQEGARVVGGARNVFGRGSTYGRSAYQGTPRFRDEAAGDLRISSSRPGAGIPSGSQPPGTRLARP